MGCFHINTLDKKQIYKNKNIHNNKQTQQEMSNKMKLQEDEIRKAELQQKILNTYQKLTGRKHN
jgi:hypothetical protein